MVSTGRPVARQYAKESASSLMAGPHNPSERAGKRSEYEHGGHSQGRTRQADEPAVEPQHPEGHQHEHWPDDPYPSADAATLMPPLVEHGVGLVPMKNRSPVSPPSQTGHFAKNQVRNPVRMVLAGDRRMH